MHARLLGHGGLRTVHDEQRLLECPELVGRRVRKDPLEGRSRGLGRLRLCPGPTRCHRREYGPRAILGETGLATQIGDAPTIGS